MPDKKPTDAEIIKAFENCYLKVNIYYCHNECPYNKGICDDKQIAKDALDLINRKDAEIEDWKKVVKAWIIQHEKDKAEIELLHSDYTYKFVKAKAKSEAYKEFADKIYEQVGFYITETNDTLNKMLLGEVQETSSRKHYLYGGLSVLYEINSMLNRLLKEMEGAEE